MAILIDGAPVDQTWQDDEVHHIDIYWDPISWGHGGMWTVTSFNAAGYPLEDLAYLNRKSEVLDFCKYGWESASGRWFPTNDNGDPVPIHLYKNGNELVKTYNQKHKKESAMNTYSSAVKIKNYLMVRWAEDIKDRDGDAPRVFSKSKLEATGMRDFTGGDGAAIIWEGFYEWTKPSEIRIMENLLEGSGFRVSPTSEWLVEICKGNMPTFSKHTLWVNQAPSFNFELNADQLLAKALELGFVRQVGEDSYDMNEDYTERETGEDMAMVSCNICHGEALEMGTLGNLKHYRCKACGIEFSVPDYGYFRGQGVQIISKASLNRKEGA